MTEQQLIDHEAKEAGWELYELLKGAGLDAGTRNKALMLALTSAGYGECVDCGEPTDRMELNRNERRFDAACCNACAHSHETDGRAHAAYDRWKASRE